MPVQRNSVESAADRRRAISMMPLAMTYGDGNEYRVEGAAN